MIVYIDNCLEGINVQVDSFYLGKDTHKNLMEWMFLRRCVSLFPPTCDLLYQIYPKTFTLSFITLVVKQ